MEGLFLIEKQQGASRGFYGAKKQLFTNETVLEHAIKFRRNLSVTYIDYQKAYSVPHPWMIETLNTYKISKITIGFLEHVMKMWKINLILKHDNGTLKVPEINCVQYSKVIPCRPSYLSLDG